MLAKRYHEVLKSIDKQIFEYGAKKLLENPGLTKFPTANEFKMSCRVEAGMPSEYLAIKAAPGVTFVQCIRNNPESWMNGALSSPSFRRTRQATLLKRKAELKKKAGEQEKEVDEDESLAEEYLFCLNRLEDVEYELGLIEKVELMHKGDKKHGKP